MHTYALGQRDVARQTVTHEDGLVRQDTMLVQKPSEWAGRRLPLM